MISGELCLHSFAFEEVRVRGLSSSHVAPCRMRRTHRTCRNIEHMWYFVWYVWCSGRDVSCLWK